eukprot:4811658-Pyramimonas_sp.AAC.1
MRPSSTCACEAKHLPPGVDNRVLLSPLHRRRVACAAALLGAREKDNVCESPADRNFVCSSRIRKR